MKENNNLINEDEEEEKEVEKIPSQIEDISTKRLHDSRNPDNILLFKVPSKEEVIKVENCSFINEIKKNINLLFLFLFKGGILSHM